MYISDNNSTDEPIDRHDSVIVARAYTGESSFCQQSHTVTVRMVSSSGDVNKNKINK